MQEKRKNILINNIENDIKKLNLICNNLEKDIKDLKIENKKKAIVISELSNYIENK